MTQNEETNMGIWAIADAETRFMTLPKICERLLRNVDGIISAVNLDALGAQLTQADTEPYDGWPLLVSAKAASLCQHLMEYKVN